MLDHLINKKGIIFLTYYSFIIVCMTFPGLFDVANQTELWVLGLPFSIFYLLLCVALLAAGLCIQFFVESKLGELDIEVTPIDDDESIVGENR